MKTHTSFAFLLTLSLGLGGFVNAHPSPEPDPAAASLAQPSGWILNASDHISGISDEKKISNPAQVDYPSVLSATPQMQRIVREKIDPDSNEGKALRSEAKRAVVTACTTVQTSQRHCGIWKKIAHSDQRQIPDVTDLVKAEL